MNVAAGPKLAAAVTNAGGIGVIGGVRQTPKMLQHSIDEIKSYLEDKNAPFGVDLLIPQVGGNARKTNASCPRFTFLLYVKLNYNVLLQYDYTNGGLSELTEVIVRNRAALFVCAVGVPPKDMVEKLHAANIPVMKYVHLSSQCAI